MSSRVLRSVADTSTHACADQPGPGYCECGPIGSPGPVGLRSYPGIASLRAEGSPRASFFFPDGAALGEVDAVQLSNRCNEFVTNVAPLGWGSPSDGQHSPQ